MIMHECSHVGCTELIPFNVRYCEKHKKQKAHEVIQSHKRNDKFGDSIKVNNGERREMLTWTVTRGVKNV